MPDRSARFDLDVALAAWRRSLTFNRAFSDEDRDELERHVRDQVEALVGAGASPEAAFEQALGEMGGYGAVEGEYRKVYWGKRRRRGELLNELTWRLSMLKNYLVVAWRTVRRHPGYAALTVAGLAVGLACAILIGLFVRFELSYDRFHEKADRTVRIAKEDPGSFYLGTNRFAVTPAPLAEALVDEFPEVEHAVQLYPVEVLLQRGGDRFYEDGLYATRDLFDVFSFRLLRGDPATALAEPGTIVLTASLAQKYFGTADPVGRTLAHVRREDEGALTVTGVVADPPPNSHLAFDFLLSMTTSESFRRNLAEGQWDSSNYYTYASLRPDAHRATLDANLAALARKYLEPLEYYRENPERISIYFSQPLTDLHLRSHINFEPGSGGDVRYVYLFGAVGLLILLIACVNYVNLATARAATRAREVGVRKVLGAHRRQLAGQFVGEAMMLVTVALGLAAVLSVLLLPAFNALTARAIPTYWLWEPSFWVAVLGAGLVVGLLAASYPAFAIARFDPVGVLKGLPRRRGKAVLRSGLVVGQFAITAALIVGTLVVHRQLHYIRTADTGLDRAQVVVIPLEDRSARAQYDALRQALLAHPGVLGVTGAGHAPTAITSQSTIEGWEGAEEGARVAVYNSAVRPGFADLFDVELVEGQSLTGARAAAGQEGVLINEAMRRALGWEAAVGKTIELHGRTMPVAGVMEDFHFLSFRQPMAPLALYLDATWFSQLLVKVRPERMRETLAHLEATVTAFSPVQPFAYEFLDDAYGQMYATEVRLGRLFGAFTLLALLIACLGILGLAAFAAAQRTKEIGIRKVLGATALGIVGLLSGEFLRLVAVAFVVAAPVAWLAMDRWLGDFAYRIDLGPGVFLLAGGLVLGIALATVSVQAVRAARADPVESLRYE